MPQPVGGPSSRRIPILSNRLSIRLRQNYALHLRVAQRLPTRTNVDDTRVDARDHHRLALACATGVEQVLQNLGQATAPERYMWFLPLCTLLRAVQGRGIGLDLSANAVLQDRQAHVDLARFAHTIRSVMEDVASCFGACEIDHVEEAVLGYLVGVSDAKSADRV